MGSPTFGGPETGGATIGPKGSLLSILLIRIRHYLNRPQNPNLTIWSSWWSSRPAARDLLYCRSGKDRRTSDGSSPGRQTRSERARAGWRKCPQFSLKLLGSFARTSWRLSFSVANRKPTLVLYGYTQCCMHTASPGVFSEMP